MRLIDADKIPCVGATTREAINATPTVEAATVVHGRECEKRKPDVLIYWGCSACEDCFFLDVPNAKYCPHCGAKMDLEE